MEALTNERWGFESNCFVCEPRNDTGLRIPFFHDAASGTVTAMPTDDDSTLAAAAEVIDHKSRGCATSSATFVILGEAQALGRRRHPSDASRRRPAK